MLRLCDFSDRELEEIEDARFRRIASTEFPFSRRAI